MTLAYLIQWIQERTARAVAETRHAETKGDAMRKYANYHLYYTGLLRKSRYILKTTFLPGPYHVIAMPLPARMSFAYIPLKLVHDLIALPLWRVWRQASLCVQKGVSTRQSRSR